MLDPRRRFGAAAELYHRYRPSYPRALVDWIMATTGQRPPARLVDVGCGTGIASRLFAERGFEVVGLDPSEEMLAFARRAGAVRYVRAEAEVTALRAQSVDLVVAAQSFHWFDLAPTLREFGRILRPEGWCAAFWNMRAPTPFLDEYDRLLRTSSTEYDIMQKQDAAPALLRGARDVVGCREAQFVNLQLLDLEGLIGRAYSSSCVKHGVEDPAAFDRALTELFDRHQRDGRVEFRYRTVALCWRLTAPPASLTA